MSRPLVTIYEADSSFVTREMNDAEYAQFEIDQAVEAARIIAEAEAKAAEEAAKQQAFNDAVAAAVAVALAAQE